MAKLIEVKLDDETSIYIEAADDSQGPEMGVSFVDEIETKGKEYLDTSIETVKRAASSIITKVKDFGPDSPDEFELSFEVKLSTDSKVIFSTLGAEANFGVKLTWKKTKE